jgi:4-hydroxy 2-oxovalerate aldolase
MKNNLILLDCTLRDGGYYNSWDFSDELINQYLEAMHGVNVDIVELGFRSVSNTSFKGACAYTTDAFLSTLRIPEGLKISVMVNASELITEGMLQHHVLHRLFPYPAEKSPVDWVRVACHVHEFNAALPAANWLKEQGYQVGFNLMQVADRSSEDLKALAHDAAAYPLDVLYFADSMGSMSPVQTEQVVTWLRSEWPGELGIHTHDNLGLALSNTLCALTAGCNWVDATVTGMGRGPGNARTEELAIEVAELRGNSVNLVPLMALIRQHFRPMQKLYGWGTNPYYYLAGKYGIHPTYIQEMLNDSRYVEEDLLAVIDHLRVEGGKKFSLNTLEAARHFYKGVPQGQWKPKSIFCGREVLLLGTGPGVQAHKSALETYIRIRNPLVVALNTQSSIAADLINLRVACHPVRLLADCETHTQLSQPLITPYSMLPDDVKASLASKKILDFGLNIQSKKFSFAETWCTAPTSLVMAYAFAIAACGQAAKVLMAGFDGYPGEDARNEEMNQVIRLYRQTLGAAPLVAITPTRYDVERKSIYGLMP